MDVRCKGVDYGHQVVQALELVLATEPVEFGAADVKHVGQNGAEERGARRAEGAWGGCLERRWDWLPHPGDNPDGLSTATAVEGAIEPWITGLTPTVDSSWDHLKLGTIRSPSALPVPPDAASQTWDTFRSTC